VQGLKDDAVGKVRVRREEEGVAEEVFRGRWEERRRLVVLSFASHWKLENEENKFVVVVVVLRKARAITNV
jgi:hypothetical protein